MVRIETRRGRLIIDKLLGRRYEWTIESSYWRNPIIAFMAWLAIPLVIYGIYTTVFHTVPVALLSTLIFANVLSIMTLSMGFQSIGTGRLNFGPHFFLALGGYTAALLNVNYNLNPAITFIAAFAVGALVGLGLSPITVISRGVYFVLFTLILPLVLYQLAYWRSDVFGAETGIPGVEVLFSTGDIVLDLFFFFYSSLAIAAVLMFIYDKTLRSKYGLLMGVVNEDEDLAQMYGINSSLIKVVTFTFTSGAMAAAGWFLAHYQGSFAGPAWLTPEILVLILLTSTLAGKGAIYGQVIAAYVIVVLREILRGTSGELGLAILYIVMLILLFALPEGFWGLYRKRRYREYYPTIKVRKEEVL